MDTSPEYIKMCEKAVELQDDWRLGKFDNGDFIYDKRSEKVLGDEKYQKKYQALKIIKKVANNGNYQTGYNRFYYIWLPRQDQLQEIMPNKPEDCFEIVERLNIFIKFDKGSRLLQSPPKSMEQLWLMFLMSGYGKFWNGEEWK